MMAYTGLCWSKITGNLVSQITVSCSLLPIETGVSATAKVYSKEILSTLIRFSIITKLNKDTIPMR